MLLKANVLIGPCIIKFDIQGPLTGSGQEKPNLDFRIKYTVGAHQGLCFKPNRISVLGDIDCRYTSDAEALSNYSKIWACQDYDIQGRILLGPRVSSEAPSCVSCKMFK